jgi:transcriptional regulator with XRE-family HTH domain
MRKRTARDRTHSHEVWLPRVKALRIKRAETGIPCTQIAQDLERNRSHVSDVMNGRRTSGVLARAIADYFGVPVEELFICVDLEAPPKASAA